MSRNGPFVVVSSASYFLPARSSDCCAASTSLLRFAGTGGLLRVHMRARRFAPHVLFLAGRSVRLFHLLDLDGYLADDDGFLRAVAFGIVRVIPHRKREDPAGNVEPVRHLAKDGEALV